MANDHIADDRKKVWVIDANALNALLDVEYKRKMKLVSQGEIHLDNLAEGIMSVATLLGTMPTVEAVVLPCKIGEKVFCILHSKNEIVEDVVEDYDIWSIKNGIKLRILLLNHNDYVVAEFGKTVFLTREEAEQARAKMDGDGNA